MTREEIMTLGFEELEERKAAIAIETDEADAEVIETLNAELEMIEERKKALDLEIEERKAAAEAVIAGAGVEIETRKEEKQMTNMEVRNTHEYIEAFAKYVKTGRDVECRSLLTENASGTVPVPEFVEGIVRTAWERDKIFSRVRKSYFRGNLKVGFEVSSSEAYIHEEGTKEAVEEELVLGIVTMVPHMIKKWITVSDEVMALGAEDFLAYIYDELAYRIIQKAAMIAVNKIYNAPDTSDATSVGVAQVAGEVSPATIIEAISKLGGNAQDLVFIASGQTIADVKIAALNASYAYDPFMGLTVIPVETFTGAIVGDLSGVQANLPEGDAVRFRFDDLSMAEYDMVKVVARLYAAIEVVGPGMFAYIDGESPSAS